MAIAVQFSLFSAYHQLPILIFHTFATILRWGCVTLFLFYFVVSLSCRAFTFFRLSVQVCLTFFTCLRWGCVSVTGGAQVEGQLCGRPGPWISWNSTPQKHDHDCPCSCPRSDIIDENRSSVSVSSWSWLKRYTFRVPNDALQNIKTRFGQSESEKTEPIWYDKVSDVVEMVRFASKILTPHRMH